MGGVDRFKERGRPRTVPRRPSKHARREHTHVWIRMAGDTPALSCEICNVCGQVARWGWRKA
jgi:hypothetical protein